MNQTQVFTSDDSLSATSEGWDIFAIDGDDNDLQLQKVDEQNIFGSDDAAWDFVINKAISGSELHQRAIAHIKAVSPKEYGSFVKDVEISTEGEKTMLLFSNGEGVSFASVEDAETARELYRKAVSWEQ